MLTNANLSGGIGRALMVGLICTAATFSARAQQLPDHRAVFAGAGMRAGSVTASGTIPVYGGDPACGSYGDATGLLLAPSLALHVPSLFAPDVGAMLRLGLLRESTTSTAAPTDPQRAVDAVTGELVDVARELRLETQRSSVALDVLATLGFGDLWIALGPSLSMRVGGEETTRDAITTPASATFRGGARERDVAGATSLTASAMGFDAVANVGFAIRLGSRARLVPSVGARLALASSYAEYARTSLAVDGGIDLLFDLTPDPDPVPVAVVEAPPPQPQPDTPREPVMTATLRSLDSNGEFGDAAAEVIYREVIERRHIPILPVVLFDSGSSQFPARVRLFDVDSKPADIVPVLEGLGVVDAQAHVLNVVGERLRANPSRSVTLTGSMSSDEPRALADARAETVRRYLLDVWRVGEAQVRMSRDVGSLRLSSESTREGREENRRVQIVASDPTVLRAVTVERRIGQAVVPVRLVHSVRVDQPVAQWTAHLMDNNGEVIRIDTSRAQDLNVVLQPEDIARETTTMRASYRAELADGRVVTSTSSVPVTWRREQTILEGSTVRDADGERTTWQILGFGFDSPELLERHRDEVRSIAVLVRDGAAIEVTGYSDRLGEEKRNIELSRQRADAVASLLRSELTRRSTTPATIVATGAGVDESRYSNDLPEGRMLSRGVTIVIEQSLR